MREGCQVDGDAELLSSNHALSLLVPEALCEPLFAASWNNVNDPGFRPYAAAVLLIAFSREMDLSERPKLISKTATAKRTLLLSQVSRRRVSQATLNIITKTDWLNFYQLDWQLLLECCEQQAVVKALSHVESISSCLVRQLPLVPAFLVLPRVLNVLCNLDVSEERWNLLASIYNKAAKEEQIDMLAAAGRTDGVGSFWDFYFDCSQPHWKPFVRQPSLPQSELLMPLTTPEALIAEGLRMQNCLPRLVRRAGTGHVVYFSATQETPATAEIVLGRTGWQPGKILGANNQDIAQEQREAIFLELTRLSDRANQQCEDFDGDVSYRVIESLCEWARDNFSQSQIENVEAALLEIKGKSKSWTDGAYTIFDTPEDVFVQLMSSVDGNEYLIEIASHQYVPEVEPYLTDDVVSLIEGAGFVWPSEKDNFLRYLICSSQSDCKMFAELTLGLLGQIFGFTNDKYLKIMTSIPGQRYAPEIRKPYESFRYRLALAKDIAKRSVHKSGRRFRAFK